jgi:hypothetical protein
MIKQGTTLVKANASNSELQNAIEAAIPQAVQQTKTIAPRYKGATEAESCKKIFDYLKNHVNYKADGANQQVRLPSALMRTLQGDCKSYSVYTSAILTNLGIPHKLVYASYDPKDPTPTHIYVITNKGCIIDAVYGKFNAEKKATSKKYKNMNISYIAGMGKKSRIGSMGKYGTGGACGIGGVDTGETWAKKLGIWDNISNGDKILFFKNLGLYALGREIVKALLRKNAGGFANGLAAIYEIARANNATPEFAKYRALELLWLKKGGNPDDLRVAFQEGNTKTPTGAKFHEVLLKQKAGESISVGEWIAAGISAMFGKKYDPATGKITGGTIGATGADDLPTWIATAPVWIPIVKEVVGIVRDAFKPGNTPTTTTDINTDSGTNSTTSTSSMLLPVLLVGGVAAAYFIFAGKKKK